MQIRNWKMELYWRSPVRLQEAALSLYARYLEKIYYGPEYDRWRRNLDEWKKWSPSRVRQWQDQRLQYIIETAAKKVPHYREVYKGRSWNKIKTCDDLCLLPLLDKQAIRNNEHAFLVENLNPKSLWLEKTSGTTGTSLKIYWPKPMVASWWAIVEVMIRHIAGVAQELPRGMIGGRPVIPGNTNRPPYWRFNRRWRQLYLSSYHISNMTASGYVDALKKYRSQWLTGYGSAIAALAESALAEGIGEYALRSVIVSGDTLSDGMRRSIETFFQCKCFDQYGQCEGVAMAMECAYGKMHIIPLVGMIEIIREDGSPCAPGEVGEIVATSLLNDAMPLIRYRTKDYAAWGKDQECLCGNRQPIITNLEGRVDDYLLLSDGRKIGRLSTALKRSPTIHSAQIVQDAPDHAYLLVRPGEGYSSSHAQAIKEDIIEKIGRFEMEIIEVKEIPKTLQGKMVLVVRLNESGTQNPEIYERIIGRNVR